MDLNLIYKHFTAHPHICIDSRKVREGSIFVALKGENHDGNLFAKAALGKGAAFAIVDDPSVVESERFILVDNALETLQNLALHHRRQFNLPVFAITGSNGKTTTKEIIAAVLSKKYNVLFTDGNLNNHIGVPLTLLRLTKEHQLAVIEMGANHIGEIGKLCTIALPTYGLITNIGMAHLEGFGSPEGVIKAKSELYEFIRQQMGKVFVNKTDSLLRQLAKGISKVTYGLSSESDYQGTIISQNPFLELKCSENCAGFMIRTQLAGSYNADNVLAAVSVGRYFGVPTPDLISAIESYIPGNNRSQIVETGKNYLLLDAYNANPTSMHAAITNFSRHAAERKMCILGDMFELGSYTHEEHKRIVELVATLDFKTVLFIGDSFYNQKVSNPVFHFFQNTNQAATWLTQNEIRNYNILIKGSRKMQLETLVGKL